MSTLRKWALGIFLLTGAAITLIAGTTIIPNMKPFRDPTGYVATYNQGGAIDGNNPFFQSLGTNGRTCETCHQGAQGLSMSVASIQKRFLVTQGSDPLFVPFDGANCPTDPQGNKASHSLLLNNGLIR